MDNLEVANFAAHASLARLSEWLAWCIQAKTSLALFQAPLQIKKQKLSAQSTVKEYIWGSKKESQENHVGKLDSN